MRLGDPGHPTVWLVHMPLSLQTSDHVRYMAPLAWTNTGPSPNPTL